MKYEKVWDAVDKLAKINGLSPSGLAKKAGLDATTFNKSKRIRPDGKKRWPSLDSINKILDVCNITFEQFYDLDKEETVTDFQSSIPYTKFSKLLNTKTNHDSMIDTSEWGKIRFPDGADRLYAVDLDSGKFEPFYRRGSMVVASKNSEIRRGDRVIIITKDDDVVIKEFEKRTAKTIELTDIIDQDEEVSVPIKNIKVINRIIWVSQ